VTSDHKGEIPMKISSSLIIQFIRLFDNRKIMEIALRTGFLKRKKGVLPSTILKVFTLGLLNTPHPSLSQIASKCEDFQGDLTISKEAIYKRLEKASLFLQEVFKYSMQQAMNKVIPVKTATILTQFKDVKICDSTKITLPDKLVDIHPGLGGRNAKSSLKIQGVYSLISSGFSSIELTKAPGADTTYTDDLLSLVHKDELLITDLGYFDKTFFQSLSDKGSYYLSRVKKNSVIYVEKAGQLTKVDITDLLKGTVVDTEIFLGISYKKQLKCRLVAVRLPEKVVNQRRRKANQKSKTQGKQLSAKEAELLAWNIVITNTTKEQLSAEAACDLYRARWQIELVFKALKSYLNLDKIGSSGKYQLECIIYGRLIAAVALLTLYNFLYLLSNQYFSKCLSILRFAKIFAIHASNIVLKLQLTIPNIYSLASLLKRMCKKSLHDKRQRKTTLEILQEHFFLENNFQNIA